MGNKFNKKTQIILRPKVCTSPPPVIHPNPKLITPCCPAGVGNSVLMRITTAGCPAMVGLNCFLVNTTGPLGYWIGQTAWPTIAPAVTWRLSCQQQSPGVYNWLIEWIPPPISGGSAFASAGGSCSPVNQNFSCRMQTGDLPSSCSGSAARNFNVLVTG